MTVTLYDVYHLFCLNHNLKYNQYDLLYVYSQDYIWEIWIKVQFTPQIFCRLEYKI